jgi:hypothetical protein
LFDNLDWLMAMMLTARWNGDGDGGGGGGGGGDSNRRNSKK